MSENKFDELQKLYDNSRIGSLVQEICEYFATKDGYEDNSYQDEIEPPEIVESACRAESASLMSLPLCKKNIPTYISL